MGSYPTLSPLPARHHGPVGGLLSVALSLGLAGFPVSPAGLSPAPCFHGARTFLPARRRKAGARSGRPADWQALGGTCRTRNQGRARSVIAGPAAAAYEGAFLSKVVVTVMSRETLGLILGFVGIIVFGGTLPMTRIAVATFDPLFLAFARAAGAGLLAGAALIVRPVRIDAGDVPGLAILAATLVIGFPFLSGIAMTTVPAAHGGVVLGVLPLATVVASVIVNGERPSAAFWLAATLGAALVVTFALRNGAARGLVIGDLWLAVSAIIASLGYAWSGRLARRLPGWAIISWALIFALPLSLIVSVWLWRPEYATAPADRWMALAYLAALSMFFGFFAWNAGLALAGVARVSQVQLLQTFVTLAIAALVLGESVDAETVTFAVAVAAVVFAGRRTSIHRR